MPRWASTTGRSPIRRTSALALAIVALVTFTSAPGRAAAVEGSISIGLVDASKDSRDPRAAYYAVDAVRPGTRLERTVRVTNGTSSDATVDVYVGGASITDEGFRLLDGSSSDIETWTTISPSSIVLGGGASQTATVVIDVPDAAPAGERYGIIWAQVHNTAPAAVVNRVGVRVYLLVDPDGRPSDDVIAASMTPARGADGGASVSIRVTNRGNRVIELTGSMALDDDAHPVDPVGTVDAGTTVLPGQSRDVVASFDGDVPNGPWTATATLTGNGIVRRARASILFPSAPGESGAASAATMLRDRGGLPPLASGSAAALIVLMLIATSRVRARRPR